MEYREIFFIANTYSIPAYYDDVYDIHIQMMCMCIHGSRRLWIFYVAIFWTHLSNDADDFLVPFEHLMSA